MLQSPITNYWCVNLRRGSKQLEKLKVMYNSKVIIEAMSGLMSYIPLLPGPDIECTSGVQKREGVREFEYFLQIELWNTAHILKSI